MSNLSIKIKSFEYLAIKFVEWFKEVSPDKADQAETEFSKLKIFKLHFFACAATAKEEGNDLLEVFNNFYALPYGPVESDIYDQIDNFKAITLSSESMIILKDITDPYFSNISKHQLDEAIKTLKEFNKDLVNYLASDLVELSHQWTSWCSTFKAARKNNKFSAPILADLIRIEPKHFYYNASIY